MNNQPHGCYDKKPPQRSHRRTKSTLALDEGQTISITIGLQSHACCCVSPVVLRLEVADRDEASAAAHCKLVLQRRPLDEGGGSVDPEDDQRGLPHALLLGPHVGVTVRSARHDTVAFGSPVNTWTRKSENRFTVNRLLVTCYS